MKKIEAIVRPERLDHVAHHLKEAGFEGFTISDVRGHGQSPERVGEWRGSTYELTVTHKILIGIIVDDDEVDAAVAAVVRGAHTGHLGDGLVTVAELSGVFSIRTAGAPQTSNATG